MSQSAGYRDVELQRIRREHDLKMVELAHIMRCDVRQAYRYHDGTLTIPECRWRLLLLELGLAKPYWTPKRRQRRAVAEYTGGHV